MHDTGLGICIGVQLSEDEKFVGVVGAFQNQADNYARKVGRGIVDTRLYSFFNNNACRRPEYAFQISVTAFERQDGAVDLISIHKKLYEIYSEVLERFYDDSEERYVFRVDAFWDELLFEACELRIVPVETQLT